MSDEEYVLRLCDSILGVAGVRQHRFEWLRGDKGHCLPVDAYYENLRLVVEYQEWQHDSPGPKHWNRPTVSGLPRDEQRKQYDRLREVEIPRHGHQLVVIKPSQLRSNSRGRLTRDDPDGDLKAIRAILLGAGLPVVEVSQLSALTETGEEGRVASYGERELIVGSTIVGMFRVVSFSALPALGHSLAIGIGCMLNELPDGGTASGVPLVDYQLVNLAGELRMSEQGPLVGALRWGGDNHWVSSGRHSFETQVTLVCDVSAHVFGRVEEVRAGSVPLFWMKLWPTLLCGGTLLQASVHPIRLEVPRDVYLTALAESRVESRRVVEVRVPSTDALQFKRALAHLQEAQRQLDEGRYNEAAITSRKAMEALAGELGGDTRNDKLVKQIEAMSDSKRAEAVGKLLAGTRHFASLAGHDLGGAVAFTRAEAVLAFRLTQELLAFCSVMTIEDERSPTEQ